jgi:hypothetical protein
MSAGQAGRLAATLLPAEPAGAADPGAEPRVIGGLRFVVDQAYRIATEARAPYVGTEHLVVAMLWQDTFVGAHELRRLGVTHARAAEQLAALPHSERAERIDPLEEVEVPTPAAAMLGELARQQAGQHPIEGWEEFRMVPGLDPPRDLRRWTKLTYGAPSPRTATGSRRDSTTNPAAWRASK